MQQVKSELLTSSRAKSAGDGVAGGVGSAITEPGVGARTCAECGAGARAASGLQGSQAGGSHTAKQMRPHVLPGAGLGHPPCSRQRRARAPSAQLLAGRRAARGRERGKGKTSVSCLECLE